MAARVRSLVAFYCLSGSVRIMLLGGSGVFKTMREINSKPECWIRTSDPLLPNFLQCDKGLCIVKSTFGFLDGFDPCVNQSSIKSRAADSQELRRFAAIPPSLVQRGF